MTNNYFRSFVCLMLILLGMSTSTVAADFKDFAVDLRDANGGILTPDEASASQTITFGLSVDEGGSVSRVASDAANAVAVITGKTGNNHGLQSFSATVPVSGSVKITMGTCSWGGEVTVKNAAGETVASFTTKKGEGGSGCYKGNGKDDDNIVSAKYVGEATTLTISGGAYVGYFAVEAVNASSATVSYSLGDVVCQGTVVPTGGTYAVGDSYTIPDKNFTLYKEGYTLTGWTDGTNTYENSQVISLAGDLALTPVFTANTVNLSDRTEPVTVKWNFRRDEGAPAVGWEGQSGLVWVAQATIGDKTIDVALPFSTSPGKFNNKNNTDWIQINNGTKFTVPSCKGATISMEAYNNITTTTIDGQSDYTQGKTISYTVAGTAETVDVVIGDGSYYRYIQVVLPVAASAGGDRFDNVSGTVAWAVGNEESAAASEEIAGAISGMSVSVGTDLTATTATYLSTQMIAYKPGTSNAGTVGGVMVEYRVKPKAGVTFKPTSVSYNAVKDGTDNATYSWSYTLDGVESAITQVSKDDIVRNNNTTGTPAMKHTENLTVDACSEFTFRIYVSGFANNKKLGLGSVAINGVFNGTVQDIAQYTLTTVSNPTEGGSINVYPAGGTYDEGTTLKLTATEKFGYDFQNWTDATGTEVSTEPVYTFDIAKDETLTANFKKVNTYELKVNVEGTNDYMVTISPAPTVVDGKNMYEAGTKVVLTANQYEGLVTFTNWNGSTTNSELSVTMDADQNITASYSQADIIAGWDFYKAGNNGRKADFAAQDNDADALNLVNTETGEIQGWLDKSTVAGGGYESLKGAAVNWRTGSKDGDVGNWHWQTKINAEAYTDIYVQFQMLYNYNAYQKYNVEYSLNGTDWTNFGSITMEGAKKVVSFKEKMPAACNNQKDLYIRMIADKTSKVDGTASKNDGNTLAMFFITGNPKLVDDPIAPALLSSVPENNATGASASGKIVLNFDKKVQIVEGTKGRLVLTGGVGGQELTPALSGKVITFDYKGLDYSTSYTFTLPANTVKNLTGATLTDEITISFTTMDRPTVEKGAYDVVVSNTDELVAAFKAAENRADKNTRFRIFVKKGTYTLPRGNNKHYRHTHPDTGAVLYEGDQPDPVTYFNAQNVSIIGEDRDATIITNTIPANDTFEGKYGTASIYEGIGNSDVLQLSGRGNYWQDLTISTGIGDALGRDIAIQDKGTRNIYKNVLLHGFQDTWTSNNDNGLYYFEGGVIRGRTDYICGKGDIYFNQVEFRQVSGGYCAVPSNPAAIGWVMKDCVINGDDGILKIEGGQVTQTATAADADGKYTLGRPWGKGTPTALWIDTKMNVVPSAIGWSEMSDGWPKRFAEYNSTTSTGSAIDLSSRKTTFGGGHTNNPVLTAAEAAEYSDMSKMFGDWNPQFMTEQAPVVTNVVLDGNTLTWTGNNYSLLYAVCKDGNIVAFTQDTTFDLSTLSASSHRSGSDAVYSVRAANEMGGLSEAVVADTPTDIRSIEHRQVTDGVTYNLQGQRIDAPTKGLYIRNGKKVIIK